MMGSRRRNWGTWLSWALLASVGLAAPARGQVAEKAAAKPARPDLRIPVRTMTLASKAVGRTLKYNVALPPGYDAPGNARRYPVIYLLHGYSGNYAQWNRFGGPKAALGVGLDLIVVMPDGGNSWYVNWAKTEGPPGTKEAWEDCLIIDVIGHVDTHFRTIARREGRAINGLSMGGYGALTLGLRHPDLFCSVGSQAGALKFAAEYAKTLREGKAPPFQNQDPNKLDARPKAEIEIEGFRSPRERSPRGLVFLDAEQADAHDPFLLVRKIPRDRLPHLCLDCGTEDVLLDASRDFVKVLIDQKIPFTYSESPGEHVGAYWQREIPQALAIQASHLRRNLAPAPPAK
jgi:putative tributyrin esterase